MASKLFDTQSIEVPRSGSGDRAEVEFARRYPLNILIAEDNYTNRRLLIILLKNLGYEAHATENGADCLKAALSGSYDVLLTDIDMPEMSGLECTTALRNEGLQLPIVAITASFPELTREQCFQAGMNGYMTKPVNLGELQRILKETALRKWVGESNRAVLDR